MITRLSGKLTKILLSKGKIDSSQEELYAYGLFMLISQALFFAVACLIGLLLNCFFEGIIFYTLFQVIRKFAGGFHASSELACEALTTLAIFSCILLIKLSGQYGLVLLLAALGVFGAAIIIVLCPVDTAEKPLDENERRFFGRVSRAIALVYAVVLIVSYTYNIKLLLSPLCVCLILEGIMLAAGKAKNKYISRKRV